MDYPKDFPYDDVAKIVARLRGEDVPLNELIGHVWVSLGWFLGLAQPKEGTRLFGTPIPDDSRALMFLESCLAHCEEFEEEVEKDDDIVVVKTRRMKALPPVNWQEVAVFLIRILGQYFNSDR